MKEAEKILNRFIKGDIARDYDKASRKHHTVTLQTALEAITVALDMSNARGQSGLLFAFIAEIKKEFADQDWEYLDFIADRILKAKWDSEIKEHDKQGDEPLNKYIGS